MCSFKVWAPSMSISVRCKKCSAKYKLKEELAGKKIRCRECQSPIRVPAPVVEDEDDFLNALSGAEEGSSAWDDMDEDPLPKPRKKKPKPKPKRKRKKQSSGNSAGIIISSILGIALLFGGIGLRIAIKSGAIANLLASSISWTSYSYNKGNVTLLMPGQPKQKRLPNENVPGVIAKDYYEYNASSYATEVAYFSFDENIIKTAIQMGRLNNPSAVFNDAMKQQAHKVVSKVETIEDHPCTIDGIDGFEMTVTGIRTLKNGRSESIVSVSRVALVGATSYAFCFTSLASSPNTSIQKKFFESIKFSTAEKQKHDEIQTLLRQNGG